MMGTSLVILELVKWLASAEIVSTEKKPDYIRSIKCKHYMKSCLIGPAGTSSIRKVSAEYVRVDKEP